MGLAAASQLAGWHQGIRRLVQERGVMIRVGFVIDFDSDWLGGVNYFRNLLNAIYGLQDRKIEAVVFTGTKATAAKFEGFPPVEIVKSDIFDRHSAAWFARKVSLRLFSSNFLLERLLSRHNIQVMSHSGFLGSRSGISTIGWVPDFQHLHLPELYSQRRLASINQDISNLCKYCSRLVLSSDDALKDLLTMVPDVKGKTKVLHFSINPKYLDSATAGYEELAQRYNFSGKYFFLPNQFWAHKNHKVVIEALAQLKANGERILVLATGNSRDSRQVGYFDQLMALVRQCDVEDCFRVLGIVPLPDLVALMKNSLAVINPSLFEGWSTTVEEAKLFGKTVVLSDIAVHREQSPVNRIYFAPADPAALAQQLKRVWDAGMQDFKCFSDAELHETATRRYSDFAEQYQQIVLSVVN
jgi:glycosyltransferase involved in cell wall biosynthesis